MITRHPKSQFPTNRRLQHRPQRFQLKKRTPRHLSHSRMLARQRQRRGFRPRCKKRMRRTSEPSGIGTLVTGRLGEPSNIESHLDGIVAIDATSLWSGHSFGRLRILRAFVATYLRSTPARSAHRRRWAPSLQILPPSSLVLSRIHAPSLTSLTIKIVGICTEKYLNFPSLPLTLVNFAFITDTLWLKISPEKITRAVALFKRLPETICALYIAGIYSVRALVAGWKSMPGLFPSLACLRARPEIAFEEEGEELRSHVRRRIQDNMSPLRDIEVIKIWKIAGLRT
ncbi:hypothetical protein CYLTODRAFT_419820 [Cylindrobasidium torrendii FP15055 ss-10]|uniref:Uncharacterized protein n=1 Tax=Cylindrobasidium torrendii FP15055 ss-10 TaxID=1314674 RepID=A0A0D7BIG2_9AGAR|nr:hypothetical protein CYLTODRAFT_419820 [Cylindrobasidium torrendii FP15055 ss-10]